MATISPAIPGMFNDYVEMLQSSPNMYSNEIATWMNDTQASQQNAIARALALREAQANAPKRNAISLEQLPYLANPRYADVSNNKPKEDPGFFAQVFGRGIDSLQGTGYGLVGLLGDAIGADSVRDWGYQGYQAQQDEIAAAGQQRKVESVFDIDGLGSAWDWAKETVADNILPMAATFGTAGIVGGLARGAAGSAIARAVAPQAVERAAAGIAMRKVAEGMGAKEAAEFAAKEAAKTVAGRAGAATGLYGSMGGMEASDAWTQDAQAHGVENTSPFMDIGVGAISGAVERFGVESAVLRNLFGGISKKATKDVAQGVVKRVLKEVPKNATKEGLTESAQQLFQEMNAKIQDKDFTFTAEDAKSIVDSFAAGALFGGMLSPLTGSHHRTNTDQSPATPTDTDWTAGTSPTILPGYPSNEVVHRAGRVDNAFDNFYSNIESAFQDQEAMASTYPGAVDFDQTLDSFLSDPAEVISPGNNSNIVFSPTPFDARVDNFYQNNMMPSDFSRTPDQFLQQQPNVQGYPAQIPVQGDQFLQQPAPVHPYTEAPTLYPDQMDNFQRNMFDAFDAPPFEQEVDTFLQRQPEMISPGAYIPVQGDQFLSQAPEMPQLPVQTPVAKYKSYLNNARVTHASIRAQLDQRHAAQRQAIDSQVAKITQANTLLNSTPASTLGMSDQQLSEAKARIQKMLISSQAELTAAVEQQKAERKQADDLASSTIKGLQKRIREEQEAAANTQATKSPAFFEAMERTANQATQTGSRYASQIADRLIAVKKENARVRDLLAAGGLTPANVHLMKSKLIAGEKEQTKLTTKLRRIANLTREIQRKATDPKSMYNTESEAQVDMQTLDSMFTASDTIPLESEASNLNAPINNAVIKELSNLQKEIGDFGVREPAKRTEGKIATPEMFDSGVQPGVPSNVNRRARTKRLAKQIGSTYSGMVPGFMEASPNDMVQASRDMGVRDPAPQSRIAQAIEQMRKQAVDTNKPANKRRVARQVKKVAEQQAAAQMAVQEVRKQSQPVATLPKEVAANNLTQEDFSRVSNVANDFLNKFSGLKGKVSVVMKAPESHANDLGFIGPRGNITLIASNIKNYAVTHNLPLSEVAESTLKHEAFGHYGLRTVLDEAQLNKFLTDVHSSLSNTKSWKELASSRDGFAQQTPMRQAEEYVAYLAEGAELGNLASAEKSTWTKLKSLVKGLLDKLGITSPNKTFGNQKANISEQDIITLLKAGALNVAGGGRIQAPISIEMGRGGDIDNITTANTPAARTARAEMENELGIFERNFPTKEAVKSLSERLREGIVDSLRPVERFMNDLKDAGRRAGKAIVDVDSNIYKVLQALPNQVSVQLRKYKNTYVNPLEDMFADYAKKKGLPNNVALANITDFVESLAAIDRNNFGATRRRGEYSSSIPTDIAEKTIKQLDSPELREIANKMQEINNTRLEIMEKYNLLGKDTKDTIARWRNAYKYYMPFKSWGDVMMEASPQWYKGDTRKSLSTPNAQKVLGAEAKGTDQESGSPISHSIAQLYDVVHLAEKVKAQQSLLNLARYAEAAGFGDMIRVVKERTPENTTGWPGLKRVVSKDSGNVHFEKTKSDAEGMSANTVAVIDKDGSIVRVFIPDAATASALRGENIMQTPAFIKPIGALTHVLGKFITSRSPLFWLTNPTRDTITAAINIHSLAPELNALGVKDVGKLSAAIMSKGWASSFKKNSVRGALFHYYQTGKTDFKDFSPEVKEYMNDLVKFMEYGGQTEYFSSSVFDAIEKDMATAMRDRNPQTTKEHVQAALSKAFTHMDSISDSLENMTRYVAFKEMVDSIKGSIEPLGAGKWRRPDGKTVTEHEIYSRAANMALNLTVNFSRKGTWAPVFNSLYMFASAGIGGNVRMLETAFRRNPETGKYDWKHAMKFGTYPMAGYMVQQMLCRALMPDDDDGLNMYDKIPDYVKANNLIIPAVGTDGRYIAIPMPYGFNVFWNMASNIFESARSTITGTPGPSPMKAASNIIGETLDNFSPVGQTSEGMSVLMPSLVRPLLQLYTNRNFAGNPIMPEGSHMAKGEIPDHQRYWSSANPSLVALCEGIYQTLGADVSPESVEHLVQAYAGGIGRMAAGLAGRMDDLVRGKGFDPAAYPGVSTFVKEVKDSDTSAIFSKLRTQAQTQINNVNTMQQTPGVDFGERMTVLANNREGMKLRGTLNSTQHRLNELRSLERKIDKMQISMSEKTERLERIKEQKKQAMMAFIKRANTAGLKDID